MHQQARIPQRKASSPSPSPQIPSSRNVPNADAGIGGARPRATSSLSVNQPAQASAAGDAPTASGLPADSVRKLDQIVQNFYTKAAAVILDSRMKIRPMRYSNGVVKVNKWYQIETDEIDDFREELRTWKACGSIENLPPPMVIEVYLDASSLKESQSLITVDEQGKRWDVMEQLQSSRSSDAASPTTFARNTEVVLERWTVELIPGSFPPTEDFGPILPTIYKKAIVFFRSLFVTTRLLPAWKFTSQGRAKGCVAALSPRCRILLQRPSRKSPDLLRAPIDGRPDPVTEYMFGDLDVPVGRLSTSVTYRNECSFRVDDAESLLSSRFMGIDENYFRPSIPQRVSSPGVTQPEVGSLRDHRRRTSIGDVQQTYGSLSTFHGDGPLGTSPMSALRSVKVPGSDTSSPPASLPKQSDFDAPKSLPIGTRGQTSRHGTRPDGSARRPSISFQPFKAGSLSGSPVPRSLEPESPASLQGRTPAFPTMQPRQRTSLTAGMPASLRGGPPQQTDVPVIGSPRPSSSNRYSSSFTHRRNRPSISGPSRGGLDDEQGSSGRQSLASSVAQPGSGFLAEPDNASSGSLPADDDGISDFLKVLDSRKTLKSFEPTKRDSAANKTVAQLSRFHLMRESNNALGDSMTSSMQLQRSSSSSSRQLTSIPGMVAPASMSPSSSSPGKPISPHTPHTPAIPSRLSENSIVDHSEERSRAVSRATRPQGPSIPESSRQSTITQEGATAIDIPLSPRLGLHQRRSSSVAQQTRATGDDEETDSAFANRSVSLGAEDREPPTLSTLLGRQMQLDDESTARESPPSSLRPAPEIRSTSVSMAMLRGSTEETPPDGLISVAQSSSPFQRKRYAGMSAGRGQTPPPQSTQPARGSYTGSSSSRLVRGDDESVGDEPLMFTLSEMDAQGRRSIEEGRGSVNTGSNNGSERAMFEPRGTTRRDDDDAGSDKAKPERESLNEESAKDIDSDDLPMAERRKTKKQIGKRKIQEANADKPVTPRVQDQCRRREQIKRQTPCHQKEG
ncbi:Autophagy-related protein 13 [Cordyceps fumosorosea ARSEF 2679]|uniref:Autophagy-related protein 13 n=1 Tax=Cordyceps fumosorosea (strain ARSEF 2679) TaxID=1081104 RepID=A0A162LH59_CORFA|nr:Autophagy-related protein 13 [Cordyceps fumosorosea ARSEF 2679]OAA70524.1 Autophagy-related protein 13 [Cordyceps fumosorosea ARSEF 2679]